MWPNVQGICAAIKGKDSMTITDQMNRRKHERRVIKRMHARLDAIAIDRTHAEVQQALNRLPVNAPFALRRQVVSETLANKRGQTA